MEKDINTEVSNTQLPATEEKANLKESLRIQKSQWIKEQIKRQREAEDAVLEQMIEEQRVIDGLNSDINENLDRTRESRKFNQEFQEKINTAACVPNTTGWTVTCGKQIPNCSEPRFRSNRSSAPD